MTEFTYIEHLDIQQKRKGSILHAEEYNATVDKINEIVDNLYASYEYHKQLPVYDRTPNTDDVPASIGTGVIIHDSGEKLYPYTDVSYVISGNRYLNQELADIHQDITNITAGMINIDIPSYNAGNGINIDTNNIISVNTNELVDNSTLQTDENGKLIVNTDNILSDVRDNISYINDNITYLDNKLDTELTYINNTITDSISELGNKIDDIVIPSYNAGEGITIDSANNISVVTGDLVDNTTLKTDENGKLTVDTTYVLTDVINDIISLDEDISYIDDRLDNELSYINSYISELNNKVDDIVIPSYNAGEGINIDEHNKISVDITPFVDDSEQPTIYLNERGQLVVNKEVVLSNAESNFVFINERGEWVGDMANVKNYIDTQDSYLDNKIDESISEIYTYMNKFTEYDTFGKDYAPSDEFINRNR